MITIYLRETLSSFPADLNYLPHQIRVRSVSYQFSFQTSGGMTHFQSKLLLRLILVRRGSGNEIYQTATSQPANNNKPFHTIISGLLSIAGHNNAAAAADIGVIPHLSF